MAREPGYGELLGRMDDLESDLNGLRRVVAVLVILCAVAVSEIITSRKGGKDARED